MTTPDGLVLSVVVPEGATPGTTLAVEAPPPPPAAAAAASSGLANAQIPRRRPSCHASHGAEPAHAPSAPGAPPPGVIAPSVLSGHAEIEPEIEPEIELLPRVHLGEADL